MRRAATPEIDPGHSGTFVEKLKGKPRVANCEGNANERECQDKRGQGATTEHWAGIPKGVGVAATGIVR